MIDYSNISQITNHQTFFGLGSTVWQTWVKPKNTKFVFITAIGGGGGGGGSTNSTSVSIAGGGGGGCSSISKIFVPSFLLPDTLYINVGMGGAGGVNAAGSSGGISTISIEPNTTSSNVIIKSGISGAGGGLRGTATVGSGTAGTGGTAFVVSEGFLSSLGTWSSFNGISGANGGAPGFNAGGTVLALNTFILTGGGGGGGRSTINGGAGGSILANGVLGRAAGGTPANEGTSGLITIIPTLLTYSSTEFPFAATGGAGGGGADNVNTGGNGGNGQIGCGGGGAGGGGEGAGNGGRGGNGIVFITTF